MENFMNGSGEKHSIIAGSQGKGIGAVSNGQCLNMKIHKRNLGHHEIIMGIENEIPYIKEYS